MTVEPFIGAVRIAIHYPAAGSIFPSTGRITEWATVKPGRKGSVFVTSNRRRGGKLWVSIYLPKGKQYFTGYNLRLSRR